MSTAEYIYCLPTHSLGGVPFLTLDPPSRPPSLRLAPTVSESCLFFQEQLPGQGLVLREPVTGSP